MGSINNRNKLAVLAYFMAHRKEGVGFIKAVEVLTAMDVRFGALGHNIEPFLYSMINFGQLEEISDRPWGGTYRITQKGIREYRGRLAANL